jgi:hypothetical protein
VEKIAAFVLERFRVFHRAARCCRRGGLLLSGSSVTAHDFPSLPAALVFNPLSEQAWAFSSSTRRVPVPIPTVASVRLLLMLVPLAAAAAMVAND